MKRKLLLPILCMLISVTFSQKTAAKKPVLLKSTITSVGSSTAFMHENKYTVQQSIGQSGIIGKLKTPSLNKVFFQIFCFLAYKIQM